MNNVCTLLWILHRILDKAQKIKQASNSQISMCFIVEAEYLSLHANVDFFKGISTYLSLIPKLEQRP